MSAASPAVTAVALGGHKQEIEDPSPSPPALEKKFSDEFLKRLAIVEAAEATRAPAAAPPLKPDAISLERRASRAASPPPPPKASASAPKILARSRSELRVSALLASFRRSRSNSSRRSSRERDRVRLGGNPPAIVRQRSKWDIVRRFVDWLSSERARRRANARDNNKKVERKVERRQKRNKVAREHTARVEAERSARLAAANRLKIEEERTAREAMAMKRLRAGGDGANARALAAAAERQDARAAAAEACDEATKRLCPFDLWTKFGGPAIEGMLDDIVLIDARYLLDLGERGGAVPRCQDVPESARINAANGNVWRLRCGWHESDCLAVLVLSYPWLDKSHPDAYGEQLRRVCPVLKAMLAACKGEHSTVGIMWDWLSLPQPPRSDEEDAVFSRGLRKMNAWYMHPFTHVLLLSCPLPTGAAYTNTKAFDARGWCYFEACASSLVKHDSCLWSYANFPPVSTMPTIVPADAPAPSTSTDDDDAKIIDVTDDNEALLGGSLPAKHTQLFAKGPDGEGTLDGLRRALRAGRKAPLSPDDFAETMERRVSEGSLSFTSLRADMQVVINLYTAGFTAAFDTYPRVSLLHNIISWFALGFGESDSEVEHLTNAIGYAAKHCAFPHGPIRISAESNGFNAASKLRLKQAVEGCSGIEELYL